MFNKYSWLKKKKWYKLKCLVMNNLNGMYFFKPYYNMFNNRDNLYRKHWRKMWMACICSNPSTAYNISNNRDNLYWKHWRKIWIACICSNLSIIFSMIEITFTENIRIEWLEENQLENSSQPLLFIAVLWTRPRFEWKLN